MSLTLTRENTHFGNKQVVLGSATFDSSYATGGLAIESFGIHDVHYCHLENKDGYSFEYDHVNKKVKAFQQKVIPPIAYEEHQILDSDYKVTLNHPAAFIMAIAKAGQSIPMRSTGVTPAANQCALTAQLAWDTDTEILFDANLGTLLSNGTFTGNATGWTLGAGWTYGTNAVDKDGDGTNTLAEDAFAAIIGHTYEVKYTISNWTVGTVRPAIGGTNGTVVGADGTYTERIVATSTAGVTFTPSNTSRFTIDAISVIDCDVYISYATQAWREVWDNLVQDEAITLATGANTLGSGNKIAAVMYMDQTEATATILVPVDEDDTAASGEIEVAFDVITGQLTANAAQNGKDALITYLKVPTSGFLKDRLFHNESATKAGGDPYTNTFSYPILIWGYSCYVPANGQTTKSVIRYADTPAAGEAVIDWFGQIQRGAGAPANGTQVGFKDNHTATGAGIWGRSFEIPVTHKLVEVESGTNLSDITTKFVMLGD